MHFGAEDVDRVLFLKFQLGYRCFSHLHTRVFFLVKVLHLGLVPHVLWTLLIGPYKGPEKGILVLTGLLEALVQEDVHTVVQRGQFIGLLWLWKVGDQRGVAAMVLLVVDSTSIATVIILASTLGKDVFILDIELDELLVAESEVSLDVVLVEIKVELKA